MTYVIAKCQFEATHNWPGVVEHADLKDVDFLQYKHRHMFHIKLVKPVMHDDRDVEIIMLKRACLEYLFDKYESPKGTIPALGFTSCEMLAKDIANQFDLQSCEVTEDGENGAIYEKD